MAPGTATSPTIETWSRMTVKFECVAKLPEREAKNAHSTISAASRPPLW